VHGTLGEGAGAQGGAAVSGTSARAPGAHEVRPRIDRAAAPPAPVSRAQHHLEVQVRLAPVGVAGGAGVPDQLAADEPRALADAVSVGVS